MSSTRNSAEVGYVPGEDTHWHHYRPDDVGIDAARLNDAVAYAEAQETKWPNDLKAVIESGTFDPSPWNCVLGPTKPRGNPCGIILRYGGIVAEWGDTARADMVFSVTKSYLATVAGLAVDDGLIADVKARVHEAAPDPAFDTPQNRAIAWHHLLQQTSEWNGTLWGIPDIVDRNRQLSQQEDGSRFGQPHKLQAPGSFWDYNDIRVNRLCLSLLQLFRRPLPDVLYERLMVPIGAAEGWKWWGYHDSVVEIDGQPLQSVVGGGHWGGGLVTTARHDARFGLLILRKGRWSQREVLSAGWIKRMLTPCDRNPLYGYLWWLNTDRRLYAAAPASSVFALGVGLNVIWIDPKHDMVMVVRWIDEPAFAGFVERVMAAVPP